MHGSRYAFNAHPGIGVATALGPAASRLAAVRPLPFQATAVLRTAIYPEAALIDFANDIAASTRNMQKGVKLARKA